jgi:hypothetical protein
MSLASGAMHSPQQPLVPECNLGTLEDFIQRLSVQI